MSSPLINRLSAEKGIKIEYLKELWDESKNEVIAKAKTPTEKNEGKKEFWREVKSVFLEKINELDIKEARLIMDNREKYKDASQRFLDAIQNDNYVAAKDIFPDVIETKTNIVINSLKDGYLRNLAAKKNEE
jgi:hypothetical protein